VGGLPGRRPLLRPAAATWRLTSRRPATTPRISHSTNDAPVREARLIKTFTTSSETPRMAWSERAVGEAEVARLEAIGLSLASAGPEGQEAIEGGGGVTSEPKLAQGRDPSAGSKTKPSSHRLDHYTQILVST